MITPTSNATNAYDLLSEIAALALEEPKRIHMNHWRLSSKHVFNEQLIHHGFPTCGTVGCIGGWVEVLVPWIGPARSVLGLSAAQEEELFYSDALLNDAGDAVTPGNGQTPEHAAKVIAHIRAFQEKHEAQLRAQQIQRGEATSEQTTRD